MCENGSEENNDARRIPPMKYSRGISNKMFKELKGKGSDVTKRTNAAREVVLEFRRQGKFCHIRNKPDFKTAMYFNNSNKSLIKIDSDLFQQGLTAMLNINRRSSVFKYIHAACQDAGIGEYSKPIVPRAFFYSTESAIYISKGPIEIAKITKTGVEIVDNGTDGVLFPSDYTLDYWDYIEDRIDPFESCKVFREMSVEGPYGPLLFKIWALTIFTDQKDKKPILCHVGEIGSGKTKVFNEFYNLLGLPSRLTCVLPKGEGNFWVSVSKGGLLVLDNVDHNIRWLQGAISAYSTGAAHIKRKLYTDDDEIHLYPTSWVGITSADPQFASIPAVTDRSIIIRFVRTSRKTEDVMLTKEVRNIRNSGLSWISHSLSKILADNKGTPHINNARHPDWCCTAIKAGRAANCERETIKALEYAEEEKPLLCIENDSISSALVAWYQHSIPEGGRWSGTAAQLHNELMECEDSEYSYIRDENGVPLNPRKIGNHISRKMWPYLKDIMNGEMYEKRGYKIYTFSKPITTPKKPQTSLVDTIANKQTPPEKQRGYSEEDSLE